MFTYKPEQFELYQWHKNGDIPGDGVISGLNSGAIVGRHPSHGTTTGDMVCMHCAVKIGLHGHLQNGPLDNTHVVCPGDYIRFIRNERNKVLAYVIVKRDFVDTYLIPIPKGK